MNSPGTRRTTAASVVTLALALAAGACTRDDPSGTGSAPAAGGPAASARPGPATGTGPYPTPPSALVAPTTGPARATSSPGGGPGDGVPRAADVDRTDPDAVGEAALTTLWTHDTAVDAGSYAAGRRAAGTGWLTGEYARQLRSSDAESVRGARWQEWTAHRARTTVSLASADDAARPADTGTEAWRQWAVTATPHGRDDWTGEPTVVAAYVHLTRTGPDRTWQVAGVLVR